MDPAAADVNASPDKSVVRFADLDGVKAAVISAVRRALDNPLAVAPGGTDAPLDTHAPAGVSAGVSWGREDRPGRAEIQAWNQFYADEAPPASAASSTAAATADEAGASAAPLLFSSADAGAAIPSAPEPGELFRAPEEPLRLYQSRGTWIVAELPGGFLMLDQHAVHERIRYEDLLRGTDAYDVQLFAFPQRIELASADTMLLVEELKDDLAEVGFEIALLGPKTYGLRSVPAWASHRPLQAVFQGALEALSGPGVRLMRGRRDAVRERLFQTIACHSAVRAGQALSDGENRALYTRVREIDLGFSDVHGRAGAAWISHDEIARRMQRGSLPD
jgi:DNA mismatch repair protein MutL